MKYYFLVGLPRSGNTLLSSILNQNNKISVTANSIVPTIMWKLHQEISENLSFKNFPDENSYNNVMSNILTNYYKDWNKEYIIDRSNWGSPNNYNILEKFCPNKPKYILLVRDIVEILASFIKWSNDNKPNFIDYETNNGSIEEKCDFLMNPNFQIVQSYAAIHNILKQNNNDYIVIDYNYFISNTNKTINDIYNFLQIESFHHRFENLNQFNANKISYNDKVLGENLHKIRTDRILKQDYSVDEILTNNVIKKYSNLNFWS